MGEGANAVVRPAVNIASKKLYAIKTYHKVKLSNSKQLEAVEREIDIISKLKHRSMIRYVDRFENRRNIHLVMEYAGKKNLKRILDNEKTSLNNGKDKLFNPKNPKNIDRILETFKEIVSGVAYIHKIDITHCDLKLENVVINEESLKVKIVDFGFARYEKPAGKMTTVICGTPNYMAPELQRRVAHHSKPTDVWALGVILYYLLFEKFPFKGKNEIELSSAVNNCEFDRSLVMRRFNGAFVQLFEMVFEKDPKKRLKADELLRLVKEIQM